jgi:phage-related protein
LYGKGGTILMSKAYTVILYEDARGRVPIAEFITELRRQSNTSKNARVNLNKIVAYIDALEEKGTRVGSPVSKHLDGDIWELRPLDNRILYAFYKDNTFLLLHHFVKKTKKTPPQEIEQAKRNLTDYIERNES